VDARRTRMSGGRTAGGGYGRPSAGRAYGMTSCYAFHGRGYEHRRPTRIGTVITSTLSYGYYKTYPSYVVLLRGLQRARVVCGYQRRPTAIGRYYKYHIGTADMAIVRTAAIMVRLMDAVLLGHGRR